MRTLEHILFFFYSLEKILSVHWRENSTRTLEHILIFFIRGRKLYASVGGRKLYA
jgi:hypothetical protein